MLNFCTYFDSNYLVKGLALYRSLVRYAMPFRLWVLCFDDLTYEMLQQLSLPQVHPILLGDFENGDEQLLQAKGNRSPIEYYFTCTPSLILYILRKHPEVDVITYLDADLLFFADPAPLYDELSNSSIAIIAHRFPPHLKDLERFGIYNVGFLSFRRDQAGLQCLDWWRSRCIEWCYDRLENGCFADQKYLDDWPTRFPAVVVIQHKGAGLAPWNVPNFSLGLDDGQVLVDSQPLVFFHFHGLKQRGRWLYDPDLTRYRVRADSLLKRHIYGSYTRELYNIVRWLSGHVEQPDKQMGSIRGGSGRMVSKGGSTFRATARKVKGQLADARMVLQGNLWVVVAGRIL